MITCVICGSDGSIISVRRGGELPDEFELQMNTPEGGFFINLTGQEPFDTMDLLDIHNGYKVNPKTKKLVKTQKAPNSGE